MVDENVFSRGDFDLDAPTTKFFASEQRKKARVQATATKLIDATTPAVPVTPPSPPP